jgi:nicotinate-nucleotide--dimethylbenzimidazole phosphoribosyltransferase
LTLIDIPPLDRTLEPALQKLLDEKAKPVGSLGQLEDVAMQIGLIKGALKPQLGKALSIIFAGDHGLTEEGVSSHPPEVTAAMVQNFIGGGATISAFTRLVGADLKVIDAGVKFPVTPGAGFVNARIADGTKNAAREPAMTRAQCDEALTKGITLARDAIDNGADIVAPGEMGIGNTASASLIVHRLAPAPLDEVIGRGAGLDNEGLERKRAALHKAASRVATTDPREVLTEFGGFEIAMMCGFMLGAAAEDRIVLIDGFIAGAAALAACRIAPHARERMIFSHRSMEPGAVAILDSLEADALLDLELRLGEGSGAALAIPLIYAAAAILTDVADYPR